MVLDITVNICNQLVKILASVFQVSTDIQMDVASGSMTIITAKRFIKNHKLLSLNAMKELVLDSLSRLNRLNSKGHRVEPNILKFWELNLSDLECSCLEVPNKLELLRFRDHCRKQFHVIFLLIQEIVGNNSYQFSSFWKVNSAVTFVCGSKHSIN